MITIVRRSDSRHCLKGFIEVGLRCVLMKPFGSLLDRHISRRASLYSIEEVLASGLHICHALLHLYVARRAGSYRRDRTCLLYVLCLETASRRSKLCLR